jgi:GT2 family glycosyltransferase
MLRADFPEVTVLQGGDLWWTGAINLAVTHALTLAKDDDYIMALNDDLVVPENYIETYYELAAKHPKTLIGSVVTDIDERDVIFSGGVVINWYTAKGRDLNRGKSLASFGKGHFEETSYLTGRGVLIPVEVFRKYGIYKDHHYKQCGDPELPRRAQMKGYRLIVSYDVPVYSYIKDKGHINHLEKFSVKNFKKYFFNVRSNFNLRYRWWFAYDCTPNVIHGTWYFLCDFTRITVHFFRRLKFF